MENATCRAEAFWRDAACWSSPACKGDGTLPLCQAAAECAEEADSKVVSFCRFRACDSERTISLRNHEICDGKNDCADGSDERSCLSGVGFLCEAGADTPPPTFGLCDGMNDCPDGSDERCL